MTGRDDDMDAAIAQAYAAAAGDASWMSVLERLVGAVGFDGAALYVFDTRPAELGHGTPEIVRGLWHNLNDGCQDDYARHWFKLDPRVRYITENPGQRILHDYLHTAEAEIDRDPYYAWYLRTQETRYYVGGQSDQSLPFLVGLTLHRRSSAGPAGEHELARFARLFDHMERALHVEFRLQRASASSSLEGRVNANPNGVVLLDGTGRVQHANPAARAFAARGDAFTLGATLKALRPADDAALQRVLSTSIRAGRERRPSPLLRLPRRTGGRDYLVIAAPMARGSALHASAACCVVIVDPDAAAELPEAALCRAFGLTTAESRLLLLLAGGVTVEQASERLEVTQATVRSHLARLLRKTGTTRQAELVALVLSLPWEALSGEI